MPRLRKTVEGLRRRCTTGVKAAPNLASFDAFRSFAPTLRTFVQGSCFEFYGLTSLSLPYGFTVQ
jgi:hypothetical protein